jgi:hypothetical protein
LFFLFWFLEGFCSLLLLLCFENKRPAWRGVCSLWKRRRAQSRALLEMFRMQEATGATSAMGVLAREGPWCWSWLLQRSWRSSRKICTHISPFPWIFLSSREELHLLLTIEWCRIFLLLILKASSFVVEWTGEARSIQSGCMVLSGQLFLEERRSLTGQKLLQLCT